MTKVLTAQQITLNLVSLINQSADPSIGGGTAAAIGSLVLRSGTGQMWLKTTAADIGWQKLVQSFSWYVVKDFGAVGDGATDDTAAIQAAVDACDAAGGGVVFFPPGTYNVTQVALAGTTNVQLQGSGTSSVVRWSWNAAGAAGSMITVSAGATNTRISLLRLDGAALTNPAAGRTNHLLSLVGAGGGVTTTHVIQCQFTGMVASSGDGVHVVGTAGNLVSRFWIVDNNVDGCSRFGIGAEQGFEYGFVVDNYMTNCDTEIGIVATANVDSNALSIHGNRLIHTSASVRHALRIEGDATAIYTRVTVAQNVIVDGFVTLSNLLWSTVMGNVTTSGAFASTDAVWRIFDAVSYTVLAGGNVIARDAAASAGPCVTVEKATGAPSVVRVSQNILVNEASGSFIKVVDAIQISMASNVCHSTDAGASTDFGIDVQAVSVNMTDVLIGPGNQFTTEANSLAACVRLLADGANITDVSVVGCQGDACDYGLQREVDSGGTFDGQVLYNANNFDSSVGDVNDIAVTAPLRIGFNASTLGANLFQGNGTPEGVVTARIGSQYMRLDGGPGTVLYYKEAGTGSTGWVGVGGAPIVFGADDLGTAATALFFAPGYIAVASATEIKFTITRPGTLRNLRVQVATAGTDAEVVTYTVRNNAVDTTLTCTLSNDAAGSASDLTHSVAVVAGNLISISIVKADVVTAGQQGVTASVEFI